MMNIQGLMKQAQIMQKKMQEEQAKLAEEEVEGASGGGMVKITLNGRFSMTKINIDKSLVDPEEIEVLDNEIKVKKYSYIFDEDALQDMVEKVAEYLLEQDDFYKKLAYATGQDKGDIKYLLKEAKKSAKDIELDEDMAINIYTKGLFNSIIGFS